MDTSEFQEIEAAPLTASMEAKAPSPRQEATDYIAHWLERLLPGGGNGEYIRKRLDAMSETDFEKYMHELASGEEILPLIAPNLAEHKLEVDNLQQVADELGHPLFEQMRLTDPDTGTVYVTPEKYMDLLMPVRRQRQILRDKASLPVGVRHIDDLSGQVTGASKGSKISMPELQILYSQGLDAPLIELIKYRGGDVKGQQLLYKSLIETGHASMEVLSQTPTKVKSVQTLSTILSAMMLKNTL